MDITFPPKSRHTSEEILTEKKATYHYQLFSGVVHGFALRANLEIENQRRSNELCLIRYLSQKSLNLGWAKEQSAKGIVGWWNRFLDME